MQSIIRPRRLLVSGGSCLSPAAFALWHELGKLLAGDKSITVITGGLHHMACTPGSPAADWAAVSGMRETLLSMGELAMARIETMLPARDFGDSVRFHEGSVRILANRNSRARRFAMANVADIVVAIEGGDGTRSVLDVAMAIERPILPLPFGPGTSTKVWTSQKEEIIKWFRIKPDEAEMLENINLANMEDSAIADLAKTVHEILLRGFVQGCFVIMRFHPSTDAVYADAIEPALDASGYQAWRTDRSVPTGDVVASIRDGINHCYFVIADTTEDRPNVMYELGLAHAAAKPVILLRRNNAHGTMKRLPFDFQTHSILRYDNTKDGLRNLSGRLQAAIGMLVGRHAARIDETSGV